MIGKHRVIVQNKRIRYEFEIRRNITVVRGDSATGKTALVDMVREYYENGISSAVELRCDKECTVLEGRTWSAQLHPTHVIIEDSNSGYQFFKGVCDQEEDTICISAQGKTNIFSVVIRHTDENVLVIADGAAFGSEMEKLMRLVKDYPNAKLYLPESFEWLILCSGIIENSSVAKMLEYPGDQIESRDYFSWERYFTAQLIQLTQNSFLKYSKRRLNPVYLQEKIMKKILAVMKGIELK